MCGIGCLLSVQCMSCLHPSTTHCSTCNHVATITAAVEEQLSVALQRRGGDTPTRKFCAATEFAGECCQDATSDLQKSQMMITVNLLSSVLHLRGETIVPQPLVASVNNSGDTSLRHLALCWNGECYAISTDKCTSEDEDFFLLQNDTEELLRKLQLAIISANLTQANQLSWCAKLSCCIAQVFAALQGEYAFILSVQMAGGSNFLFFGRDPLGRRSLLIKHCSSKNKYMPTITPFSVSEACQLDLSEDIIILSSVAPELDSPDSKALSTWIEIPPGRIFSINLTSEILDSVAVQTSVGLDNIHQYVPTNLHEIVKHEMFSAASEIANVSQKMLVAACELYQLLNAAVRRRVLNVPHRTIPQNRPGGASCKISDASVGVLFSGGLDSVVLAALCNNHVSPYDPIDLINVAFYNDMQTLSACKGSMPLAEVPDRAAALASFQEMTERFPLRKFNFIAVDISYSEVLTEQQHILSLIKPRSTHMDFNIGTAMWFASRGLGHRISSIPEITEEGNAFCHASKSLSELGGNATNIHSQYFGSSHYPVHSKKLVKTTCATIGCPRSTISSCAFRSCTFCCSCHRKRISQYLGGSSISICHAHPTRDSNMKGEASKKMTELTVNQTDSKCQEKSLSHDGAPASFLTTEKLLPFELSSTFNFLSGAKVLLVGLGADEQMAGYGRHRSVYKRGGYSALRSELNMEMGRLWYRNLGRDDRCISDHGKEARFPFLDEDVVNFLFSTELNSICDMDREQGVGDKMILRLIAKMVGVKECSHLVKRAIQFGSRIAKVSEAACFASRRQASGSAKFTHD